MGRMKIAVIVCGTGCPQMPFPTGLPAVARAMVNPQTAEVVATGVIGSSMMGPASKLSLLACVLAICTLVSTAAETNPPALTLRPASNASLGHEVQRAIDKGQAWLVRAQNTNGFWSTPDHPAVTGLALTALKIRPGGQEIDPAAVKKGYAYLLACVKPDGGIYQKDLSSYNTSISLTALVAGNRPEWRPIIENARKFVTSLQTASGGIGYGQADKEPDLSNTSWALEAMFVSKASLGSESTSGASDLNWQAAISFIQSCQNLPSHNPASWASGDPQNKGGFIYAPAASKAGETNLASGRVALRSYGSMSYAGMMSYIYADLKHDDPRVTAVMDWLSANYSVDENPALGQEGLYYYYHTMAKALSVYGTDTVLTKDGRNIKWREQLALKLINLQRTDGSWANENGRWWEKDPALVTAYSLMALEMIHARL